MTKHEKRLIELFDRNGYIRFANEARIREGRKLYRKGWEVRLLAESDEELSEIVELLEIMGHKIAKPFVKRKHIVQPVYGKLAAQWFLERSRRKDRYGDVTASLLSSPPHDL